MGDVVNKRTLQPRLGAARSRGRCFCGSGRESRGPFQGDVDALAAALVEEPETARRRQICEVTTKARPTREDTTLTAQQEARLEERAQKRAAREDAKLLKKAELFKELGFAKEKEQCERFALRLGAGLESTIVGDLTIPRQLLELRDETLKSGATPRRGALLPLIDAARAADVLSWGYCVSMLRR